MLIVDIPIELQETDNKNLSTWTPSLTHDNLFFIPDPCGPIPAPNFALPNLV